jgi:hypothetical protein
MFLRPSEDDVDVFEIINDGLAENRISVDSVSGFKEKTTLNQKDPSQKPTTFKLLKISQFLPRLFTDYFNYVSYIGPNYT